MKCLKSIVYDLKDISILSMDLMNQQQIISLMGIHPLDITDINEKEIDNILSLSFIWTFIVPF